MSLMPEGYIPPNVPPKCTWSADKDSSASPHHHVQKKAPRVSECILDNVLQMVGNTPLVRLDKIAKSEGLECELLAKCEFFNAGGSVKDRIGVRMVEEAEKDGILKAGDTIIEPTSGNTGIGLALSAAVKGYKCIICLPEKMSNEKVAVLRALGAEIRRTPTEAAFDTPESHVGVAWKLNGEIATAHILDQYRNPGNPLAHYDGTGAEIYAQCGGKVDMVVAGAGTGGTIAGIGRKLKPLLPNVQIVAVDPEGSILAEPESLNEPGKDKPYHVEGIGYDFLPTVLDRSVVDKWYKCEDKENFMYARRLIREEGLLCGGSSGAAVAAAVKAARSLKAGQRCVVLLPDSIRNYITKFVDESWLVRNGLVEPSGPLPGWYSQPLSALGALQSVSVKLDTSVADAFQLMKDNSVDQLPVVDNEGSLKGVVTSSNLVTLLSSQSAKSSDPVGSCLTKSYPKIDVDASDTNLGKVSEFLKKDSYVVLSKKSGGKQLLAGVVTAIHFANYICNK